MSDTLDHIQAFVDGEPVDPVALEAALADPDGRAHLVDIVVLRGLVKRSTTAIVEAGASRPRRRPYRWIAAAAAAVLVATLASIGGYVVGERRTTARQAAAPPVTPTVSADINTPSAAPAPTTVITFKPGVDWTERGGH